jgi:hypothetical protein
VTKKEKMEMGACKVVHTICPTASYERTSGGSSLELPYIISSAVHGSLSSSNLVIASFGLHFIGSWWFSALVLRQNFDFNEKLYHVPFSGNLCSYFGSIFSTQVTCKL